ncbi:carbohydrate ABC transporter permease [Demequina sp.]|uniref:carbohydrate ABC transporter permease n=1 Tax=Demequina sp. TaxID=2050685 RepID=UPI0025E32B9E|nr:sugar ABC transporter permease [Demequina sp.]
MLLKSGTVLVTVAIGIAGAIALFWALNKLAELLPSKWEHRLKPYLLILPAYLAISLYLLYPTIVTVINSFKDRTSDQWVGFTNYADLFTDKAFQSTLFNTVLWVIIVPAVTIIVGLAVAALTDRLPSKSEKFVKTMIFVPMAISMVGAATVWRFVYAYQPAGETQTGLLNAVWTSGGAEPVPWLNTSTFRLNTLLLMVILLWAQVGYAMVLLSAAIKSVPAETLEAARVDGAEERQVFFSVILPQIKGTIIAVGVTVTIGVMKIFDIVYTNTNGQFNTNVLANDFINELTTNFNYGAASAIVVILMIAVIPIMIYQVRNFKEQEAAA